MEAFKASTILSHDFRFACPWCDKTYISEDDRDRHERQVHFDTVLDPTYNNSYGMRRPATTPTSSFDGLEDLLVPIAEAKHGYLGSREASINSTTERASFIAPGLPDTDEQASSTSELDLQDSEATGPPRFSGLYRGPLLYNGLTTEAQFEDDPATYGINAQLKAQDTTTSTKSFEDTVERLHTGFTRTELSWEAKKRSMKTQMEEQRGRYKPLRAYIP